MSDGELAAIRQKKLREYQQKLKTKTDKPEPPNPEQILDKIFKDRAREVYNTASQQYPEPMNKIRDVLVKLATTGRLTEVTGQELYHFLLKLGLDVRLNTTITYSSHGQNKTLEQKMREELQKP
jgi:DNA-binding TFAR19-related protein (PDSD5 family)